jgi:signal transduction histidine kinase
MQMKARANNPMNDALGPVLRDYVAAAERLEQTHASLQGEVMRLREELVNKDRELERRRRLAALGELAAGVAHEVRNPLGAMQLYSGLLRNTVGGASPALELIEKIERGIQAIDRVVRDTLALVPSRGRFAPCDVRCIAERAAEVCRPVLEKAGVHVSVVIGEPEFCIAADEDGVQRVLVNLISNAADASPAGSGITVAATLGDAGWAEIRVADRGTGLPEELLDRLFDPFVTTKPHGTGLGLSIAYRLVEAHGGRLSATNRLGGGAEFTILLPIAAAESGPQSSAAPECATESGETAARRPTAA